MADLSRVQARQTQQDRLTTRRDGVLPARRNTNAPDLEVNASMRSARRDSGADELMRVLSGVNRAAASFESYANAKHEKDEAEAGVRGAADVAAGTVDPEQAARSAAYRNAVTTGEARKKWYDSYAALEKDIHTALNDPNDPADEHDVNELIDARFKELGLDGAKPRDFGSPSANKLIAEAMMEARPRLLAGAREVITKQVQERSVATTVSNTVSNLATGGRFQFEDAFSTIVPGTDLKAAKDAIITGVVDFARSIQTTEPERAVQIIDDMLGSKRADGKTPSLAPDDLASVRSQRTQMTNAIRAEKERAERDAWDQAADTFRDRINGVDGAGAYPTMAEIRKARASNTISSEHANALLGAIETDQREAEAEARRASRGSSDEDSEGAAGFGTGLMAKVYSGEVSISKARVMVLEMSNMGLLGSGKERKKRVAALSAEMNNVASLRGGLEASPEGVQARRNLRRAAQLQTERINGSSMSHGQKAKARKWIKQWQDYAIVTLGRQEIEKGDPADTANRMIGKLGPAVNSNWGGFLP